MRETSNSIAIGRFLQGSSWIVREGCDEEAPEDTALLIEICQPGKEITVAFPDNARLPTAISLGAVRWFSSNADRPCQECKKVDYL